VPEYENKEIFVFRHDKLTIIVFPLLLKYKAIAESDRQVIQQRINDQQY